MFTLEDVCRIESDQDDDELEYCKSIQRAINSGMWSLQGSYGRTMMDAIKSGYCMLGTVGRSDYYGNYIPSRYEVADGSFGSYDFVVERRGEYWAEEMKGV